jgi:16S rRNA (guanine966-N2)-methyltransferase
MFSALDARGALEDATVLDLYAGTGALAIEAVSRGAATAVVVERDRSALEAIHANVEVVSGEGVVEVVARDVVRFLAGGPPPGAPFDLVFVDPPYETADEKITDVLAALVAPGWLAPDAIVSVERPHRHPVVAPAGLTSGWERTFGDTLLTFLFL